MSNSTYSPPNITRSYPYAKAVWLDTSGSLRWTLTTSNAAIVSALLAMLVALTVARFLCILYTNLHISLLQQKTATVFDDQTNVIAINTLNPSSLLWVLSRFAVAGKRRVYRSAIFQTVFGIGFLVLVVQGALLFLVGSLFSGRPIPFTPGQCGMPYIPKIAGNGTILGTTEGHMLSLTERASTRFSDCTDNGDKIICPGPAQQTFSWDVSKSEPSYCWFGPQYCYNGSRTITQRATITPQDFGTTRRSRMSLTVMAECSQVNNTAFIKRGYDPSAQANFTAYNFGTDAAFIGYPYFQNASTIVYDDEYYMITENYRLSFEYYQIEKGLPGGFTPSRFLVDSLQLPFRGEHTNSSSSVNLIFNRLFGVNSLFANADPFFLTNSTLDPHSGHYNALHPVSTLVCRDKFQLTIDPQSSSGNGTWIATGTSDDITSQYAQYLTTQDPKVTDEFDAQFLLYVFGLYP